LYKRYGLWAIRSKRSVFSPDIWRETKDSYQIPTKFQRFVGIRYETKSLPRQPDSCGVFGAFAHNCPPQSIYNLLKDWFTKGHYPRANIRLISGYKVAFCKSTGYALLWAPRIKYKSYRSSAILVAEIVVKEKNEP